MKVFIVDDNAAVRSLLEEMTSQAGWQAIVCPPSDGIMARVKAEKPDVFLLDYIMPKPTGLELAQEIRNAGISTPIIFYSGMASEIDVDAAEALNIHVFLEKPIQLKKLCVALSDAIRE